MPRFLITGVLLLFIYYGGGMLTHLLNIDAIGSTEEARTVAEQITPLPVEELKTLLKNGEKPSIVLIYASWCPYCKQQHEVLQGMLSANPDSFNLVAISTDENRYALATFLSKKPQPLSFKPYIMSGSEYRNYQNFFYEQGGMMDGGIPYLGVFSPYGAMKREFQGLSLEPALNAALDTAH